MIKHVVIWKLKENALGSTKAENALKLKHKLESLKDKIPGILSIEVGINKNGVGHQNHDVVLIIIFESTKDLIVYQDHPAHEEVKEFVKVVRDLRACVDFEF